MFQIILFFVNLYHEFIDTLNTSELICLMTISLNLFGFVWVFECDVIGATVKKLRLECCLFGQTLETEAKLNVQNSQRLK